MALATDYQDNPFANPYPRVISPVGSGWDSPAPRASVDTSQVPGQPNATNTGIVPPAPSNGGYSGPKDFMSLVKYWQTQHPASAPDMPGLIAFLNAQGVPVSTAMHNGMASDDKILYNGQTYDLGSSLGGPGATWFSDFGPMGPDTGNGGGSGAPAIDQSYLAPFTKQFVMPSDAALPRYGGAPAFSFADFQAPTANDVLSDPGYQFRQDQGRKSIETSASAKGLLNSGGTLADLLGFGQQLGSQEFGNVFDRKYNTWNANRQNAADAYRVNYSTQFSDPYQFDTTRANTSYDRAQQQFQNDQNLWFKNQDSPFNKLFSLSQLGLNSANA